VGGGGGKKPFLRKNAPKGVCGAGRGIRRGWIGKDPGFGRRRGCTAWGCSATVRFLGPEASFFQFDGGAAGPETGRSDELGTNGKEVILCLGGIVGVD